MFIWLKATTPRSPDDAEIGREAYIQSNPASFFVLIR